MTYVTRRRLLAACGLSVAPTMLSGCGLLDASQGERGQRGGIESPVLQVGLMPIVGAVPLSYALSNGMFRGQRLEVRTTTVRSGAVSVPTLGSGRMQVTFSNDVSFSQAQSRGIDLRIIAEGSRSAPKNFAIVTRADSSLTSPEHLRNRRIGVHAEQHRDADHQFRVT